MLMRHERLAALQTAFDERDRILTVRRDGEEVARGCVDTEAGRAAIEDFFGSFMDGKISGKPNLVAAPVNHMFSDHMNPVLSVINLATIRDIERVVGKPVDPLRFRANLYVDGAPPWSEFQWVGGTLEIGSARLTATERIDRCAATTVKPGGGVRDINIPARPSARLWTHRLWNFCACRVGRPRRRRRCRGRRPQYQRSLIRT